MTKEEFKRKPLSALALRLISPGYSHCEICGLPWNHCEGRGVDVTQTEGVTAVCTYCWDHYDLESIEGAYSMVYHDLQKKGYLAYVPFNLEQILKAVEKDYHMSREKEKKKKIDEYLEAQNDEYNYGHSIPNHEDEI